MAGAAPDAGRPIFFFTDMETLMTNPETLDKLSADGRPGCDAFLVELTGVLCEGEQRYTVFRAGFSNRRRPILATDLDACAAWQRRTTQGLAARG